MYYILLYNIYSLDSTTTTTSLEFSTQPILRGNLFQIIYYSSPTLNDVCTFARFHYVIGI